MEPLDASMFVDPETHEPVTRATLEQLEELNRALSEGGFTRQDGGETPAAVDGAYLSKDGLWAYPDVDGLASFVVEMRLVRAD
ncbi:MAG: hypothetical protein AB8I08_29325 [Sandaracinaceae bacterium]